MGKRIKKGLALLLAAALLMSVLAGCGSSAEEAEEENIRLQTLKEDAADIWFDYLKSVEEIYGGVFRILEYMQEYARDNSWDSLLKARAAAGAALVSLQQMSLPEFMFPEEDIQLLIDADVEIGAMLQELENLENIRADKEITVTLLRDTLEHDIFLMSCSDEALPDMLEFYCDYFAMECRYTCQFTNYLLLQLEQENKWSQWQDRLPSLAECADEWYADLQEVEEASGKLLTEIEVLQADVGSVFSMSEYSLEIVQDAVQTGDLTALSREINWMEGVPGYFPVPVWLPDTLHLYLTTDPQTDEKHLVQVGEELAEVPSACYIQCGAVEQGAVEAYEETLKTWGIVTYAQWDDSQQSYQLLASSGDSTMMIEWTQEETILYLTSPVGCLIPELYLMAMIAE